MPIRNDDFTHRINNQVLYKDTYLKSDENDNDNISIHIINIKKSRYLVPNDYKFNPEMTIKGEIILKSIFSLLTKRIANCFLRVSCFLQQGTETQGNNTVISPSFLVRIRNILEHGLGGKGGITQGKIWAEEEMIQQSSVRHEEQFGRSGFQIAGPSEQYNKITAEHIKIWQDISKKERNIFEFSQRHNINPHTFHCYVNREGTTKLGDAALKKASGHQFDSVTAEHIQMWQDMSKKERDLVGFSKQHNLNLINLRSYLNKQGATKFGKAYLQKASGYRFHSVAAEHIKIWKEMPKEERDLAKFSGQYNLNPNILRHYLSQKGTKGLGESLLKRSVDHQFDSITGKHLRMWEDMPKQSSDLLKFAERHNLNPDILSRLVNKKGISKGGKVFLQKASGYQFTSVTVEHIKMWKEIPENERNMTEFADRHNLNPDVLSVFVNKRGVSKKGKVFLQKASGYQFTSVTVEHIQMWQKIPENERNMTKFAERHNLNPDILNIFVNKKGVSRRGKVFLQKASGYQFTSVTAKYIKMWKEIPENERNMAEFADRYNLNPGILSRFVNKRGFSQKGKIFLQKASGYQFASVTAEHIKMWKEIPENERDMAEFAEQHNLYMGVLRNYINKEGVKARGKILLQKASGHQFTSMTAEHIQIWQKIPENERNIVGFAKQHNLYVGVLRNYINKEGVKARGEIFLQKAFGHQFTSMTAEHIQMWQKIPENERNMTKFAEQHNLYLGALAHYINKQGIKRRGEAFLEKASKRQRLDSSEDVMLLTDIKSEPGSRPVDLKMQHQVDNSYPILQDPKDPNVSILLAVEESIEELKVTRWYELNEMFDDMPASDVKTIKHKINQAVRSRINQDENSLPNVRKEKLESLMYEKTDLADGHPRGVSVYALRDIQQFDVLGAYAGALYQNRESLQSVIRQFGERNVLAYGWETPKNKGFISGFNRGNILSRINTAMLPTGESIPNAKNNVAAIGVGKYLIVYIAKTEIKTDEELLVNYGDTYQPVVIDPNDIKPAL